MSELDLSSGREDGTMVLDRPQVLPPDYRALRLVAELTGSLSDDPVQWDVAHGSVTRMRNVGPPSDDRVQIRARNHGRTGRMSFVSLQVQGAVQSLDLPAKLADAVFWSESAVEKFLVPYVASAGAWEAGRIVQQLQTAFYREWENAKVVALAHRSGVPDAVPARLDTTLSVLFVDEDNVLREQVLSKFLQFARPGISIKPREREVPLGVGTLPDEPPFLPSYTQLRGIAEWASSLRTEPQYFLFDVLSGKYGSPIAKLPPDLDNRIVIPAFTPPQLAERLCPQGLWLQPDDPDTPALNVADEADAAFWSTGALEKFLFPYYASAAGAMALDELKALHRAWTKGAARRHAESLDGHPETLDADAPEVYSIIHLPKSNWVAESDGAAHALDQLGVAHAHSRGHKKHAADVVTLREYLRRHGR